jgi:hypothetical protein
VALRSHWVTRPWVPGDSISIATSVHRLSASAGASGERQGVSVSLTLVTTGYSWSHDDMTGWSQLVTDSGDPGWEKARS